MSTSSTQDIQVKRFSGLALAALLAASLFGGCAGSPPKPPAVDGEYRPINWKVEKPKDAPKPASNVRTEY